jgi:hypothetical protein
MSSLLVVYFFDWYLVLNHFTTIISGLAFDVECLDAINPMSFSQHSCTVVQPHCSTIYRRPASSLDGKLSLLSQSPVTLPYLLLRPSQTWA